MVKKLADQNLVIGGLEALKLNEEKQVNQICTRIISMQTALIRADGEENKFLPMTISYNSEWVWHK